MLILTTERVMSAHLDRSVICRLIHCMSHSKLKLLVEEFCRDVVWSLFVRISVSQMFFFFDKILKGFFLFDCRMSDFVISEELIVREFEINFAKTRKERKL